ncbi:urease accessory protein UreE [Paracoccus sp. CPCC 101403]|uniref:Urease accessory protein UreE n=1 Tax=Paracoccus broussonetiae TaxID=3075834 RepID=A0ABU3EJ72_9RHOB|nr:urease accessory protein UreE [Paracoccus sp. CPCC 101403]MDT1063455.1 urease accessory protein UreE [Paracoccus sp. CPCC 101403]
MSAPLFQLRATTILRATPADDSVILDYEGRFLRRKRLLSGAGVSFLVDLAETVSLDPGDAFQLEDGRLIGILAAMEPCLRVEGTLPRLAWHIGNRHTPCQIATDHLLIRADHVLEGMLKGLGALVTPTMAPFAPEGGAYGHGRTMGHDHGPGFHAH